MRFRWANGAVLVLLAAELASGLLGLMSGSGDRAFYMHVHRGAGYALVLALAWKGANVALSLRGRRARTSRVPAVVLMALVALTLGLAYGWSMAGPYLGGPFTGLSWHAYLGVDLVPLLAWHVHRYVRPRRMSYVADRRLTLRLVAMALAGTLAWWLELHTVGAANLRGRSRRFTGSYNATTGRGNGFPVTSWLNDRPAPIDLARWRLEVRGDVERPLRLPYEELGPRETVVATLDCTGGWYTTQEWGGVPLARLLERAGLRPGAASVTVTSVTGYYRRFPLKEAHRLLLATHVGGEPLSHGHGAPLRLVVPGARGYQWVKWVTAVEVDGRPHWLQPPLPLQ